MSLLASLPPSEAYQVAGSGALPSAFAVSELATASFAAVGHELGRFMQATSLISLPPTAMVDHRLASLWFG